MMEIKDMVAIVKQGAESRSAGITKKVEFTVKPDTKNPGGITIGWVTEYGGNKYGDYLVVDVKTFENDAVFICGLGKAGSLLAEQCLCLLEDLKEAKQ